MDVGRNGVEGSGDFTDKSSLHSRLSYIYRASSLPLTYIERFSELLLRLIFSSCKFLRLFNSSLCSLLLLKLFFKILLSHHLLLLPKNKL